MPEYNNRKIHPQEVMQESRIASSKSHGWRGIIVNRNAEQPSDVMNALPMTHHYINLVTKMVNVGRPARQISRFADLTFEGEMKPGVMFLIPARVPGFFSWTTLDHTICLGLDPQHLQLIAEESFAMNPRRVELLGHPNLSDATIERLAHLFNEELEADAANGTLYADSLATALAVHLLRTRCAFAPVVREYKGGLSKFQLNKVIGYINDNLSQDVSLAELSSAAGLSSFHFARAFKQSTGFAPHQYVIRRRIERAKILLKENKLPLSEIALSTGFTNQSHLSQVFRRLVGASPAAYRNSTK